MIGFVGLGNMGGALALNVVESGAELIAYDAAGPSRVPTGAVAAASVEEIAARADVVVFSLPDGPISSAVVEQVVAAPDRRVRHIIDTSTVGLDAARRNDALLAGVGIGYVDAPVSGGVAGARARTLAVIYAGTDDACAAVEPVLARLSDRRHRVGDRAGLGQALKLANNFLSATALAATSEAVAFGVAAGLDMGVMLEVLNASSGRSGATDDKFPNHVVTQKYASGFANTLMRKDVALYLDSVGSGPSTVGQVTREIWERFAAAEPGVDFTRIYPFVAGS